MPFLTCVFYPNAIDILETLIKDTLLGVDVSIVLTYFHEKPDSPMKSSMIIDGPNKTIDCPKCWTVA